MPKGEELGRPSRFNTGVVHYLKHVRLEILGGQILGIRDGKRPCEEHVVVYKTITVSRPGPCTPMVRVSSMSAVLLGPVSKVILVGGESPSVAKKSSTVS